MNHPKKFALPMMTFIFEDPEICEDTFSLLMHYQLYAAINHTEREKIKRTAQLVLKGFFNFSFKTIEQSDITLNENKTIKIVTDIENRIFEKIYAYLRPTANNSRDTDPKNDQNQENDYEDENKMNSKDDKNLDDIQDEIQEKKNINSDEITNQNDDPLQKSAKEKQKFAKSPSK